MKIICDWGSSNLRAYFVKNGTISETYESDLGLKKISGDKDQFTCELKRIITTFGCDTNCAIQLSGMVGSKNGYLDAGYAQTPINAADFSSHFIKVPNFENAIIYSGLKHCHEDTTMDVMRGEEVQIFGALAIDNEAKIICLPGTHSKWAQIKNQNIVAFKTTMTGDLFMALSQQSIFKEQITDKTFDEHSFVQGCKLAYEGNRLDDLFKLRSAYIFSKISSSGFHSYLSGFLIANEIRAHNIEGKVHLCASDTLLKPYSIALKLKGIESVLIKSDQATIKGHLKLSEK